MKRWLATLLVSASLLILCGSCACQTVASATVSPPAAAPGSQPPPSDNPLLVFVSDLHLSLGMLSPEKWNPIEDFRWTNALKGFLAEISRETTCHTTLVIDGDFLEMWQHPSIACDQGNAELGCTVNETIDLAGQIVKAHAADLKNLGEFASCGSNRLVIIPGNHDAALLVPGVRQVVFDAFKARPGTVEFVGSGTWVSSDGKVVSEHGHQMPGENINAYSEWPVVTKKVGNVEFLVRPWGEQFVHQLYDKVEQGCEAIDNVIPQSQGASYYQKREKLFEKAKDLARFLAFNIAKTSLAQKFALKVIPGEIVDWDITAARAMGYKLFAAASDDPVYRANLLSPPDETWRQVSDQLTVIAKETLQDEEISSLCDRASALAAQAKQGEAGTMCRPADPKLLISTVSGLIPGYRLVAAHLTRRIKDFPYMQVFIYGHTHELQCTTEVKTKGGTRVEVANTGAFQRLIDNATLVAKAGTQPVQDVMCSLKLDDLPPCYTAVRVTYSNGFPNPLVQNWFMGEHDTSGAFVDPWDSRCARVGKNCDGSSATTVH